MDGRPGTNYFTPLDENVNISLRNESGFAVLADCIGNPNVVALHENVYNTGCEMIRNDITTGANTYFNTGTLLNPVWTLGGGGGGSLWTPLGVTTATVGGIPAGTNLGTTPIDPAAPGGIFDQEFYPALGPHVTLATSPAGGLRETGDAITSVDLTPTTTAGSDPITSLALSGTDGFSFSYPSPNPSGGTEPTQTDSTGFSTNNSYTATVSDGTRSSSAIVNFTFASAYYYGSADQGLDISADGGGLTKLVIGNTPTLSEIFNCVFPQVYYFAYPASYPPLTSIKDNSGFETINVWTVSTVSVTNSFGSTVSYRQYEFNNPNTTSNFTNTFKQ